MSADTSEGFDSRWMLAIDTSSDQVSLALSPGGRDATGGAELAWLAARNQTATLLAQIDRLCRLCEIESDALGAVVVATGPGGFNALRVGMSVAKGFAFALGVPLFGVGTLDLAARPFARWGLPVRAFVPAGRGRVVFADFVPSGTGGLADAFGARETPGGALRQHGEMGHRAPLDLAADLTTPTVLVGDLTLAEAALLVQSSQVVLPDAGLRRRRAALAIDIALPRWQSGEADDLTALEPLYVHQPPQAAAGLVDAPMWSENPGRRT